MGGLVKDSVVVAQIQDREGVSAADSASGWSFLMLVGCGIAAVGLIDLAFVVFPARPASLEWELGAAANWFDGMPLLTLGIGMMTAGAVATGGLAARRLMLTILI